MTPKAIRTDAHQLVDRPASRPRTKVPSKRLFRTPEGLPYAGVANSGFFMGELAAHHPQPPFRLHGADAGVRPIDPLVARAIIHGYLTRPARGSP